MSQGNVSWASDFRYAVLRLISRVYRRSFGLPGPAPSLGVTRLSVRRQPGVLGHRGEARSAATSFRRSAALTLDAPPAFGRMAAAGRVLHQPGQWSPDCLREVTSVPPDRCFPSRYVAAGKRHHQVWARGGPAVLPWFQNGLYRWCSVIESSAARSPASTLTSGTP